MWNCHSWPLDVSNNVKLPFLTNRHQYQWSITRRRFVCQILCTQGRSIGFLLFLELQKSLLASFQGCWTQWQRFESSSIHHFWDTPQHFLKTHFCLKSGFISFLELQKCLLASFQGCWTQWWQLWKFHCLYLGLLKRYMRKCSFSSVKLSQFLQYLSKYALLSFSVGSQNWTKQSGHGKMSDPPGELLHTKDLLTGR